MPILDKIVIIFLCVAELFCFIKILLLNTEYDINWYVVKEYLKFYLEKRKMFQIYQLKDRQLNFTPHPYILLNSKRSLRGTYGYRLITDIFS